jgi:hypothetical protein
MVIQLSPEEIVGKLTTQKWGSVCYKTFLMFPLMTVVW